MKWVKHDDYALVSDCGCYSVAKIGGAGGYRYEVYRTRKHPDGPHLVAHNLATSKEARQIAQDDDREG